MAGCARGGDGPGTLPAVTGSWTRIDGGTSGATGWDLAGEELWRVETDGRVESDAIVGDRVFSNEATGSVPANGGLFLLEEDGPREVRLG